MIFIHTDAILKFANLSHKNSLFSPTRRMSVLSDCLLYHSSSGTDRHMDIKFVMRASWEDIKIKIVNQRSRSWGQKQFNEHFNEIILLVINEFIDGALEVAQEATD